MMASEADSEIFHGAEECSDEDAQIEVSRLDLAENCLAKALYDNVAESPDELAFRKGDILTVLEQNTACLEGWWLCSLRGRQGIVPGNRLRLLPGIYDQNGSGILDPNAQHSARRSWTYNPNKVVTPQKIGSVYLYDVPPGAKLLEKNDLGKPSSPISRYVSQGTYDTPLSSKSIFAEAYDEPKSTPCRSPIPTCTYDSPRPNVTINDNNSVNEYDVPISDQSATYDVPRSSEKDISHIITISDNYDIPPSAFKGSPSIYEGRAFSRSSNSTSGSSSFRSPSGSHSSIETLSLSSGGVSNRSSLEQHPNEVYDIPPEPQPVGLRPPGAVPYTGSQDVYDVPQNNSPAQFYDVPPKQSASPAILDGVYDIPPQATRDSSPVPKTDVVDSISQITNAAQDIPDGNQSKPIPDCSELLLDRESAVELLMKYQHEVQSSISKLFSFVSTTWRKLENMEAKVGEIESICHKLQSSLVDLYNFAQGALANSTHAADKSLSFKLSKLVLPIKESCGTVKICVQALDDIGWIAAKLSYSDESYPPDELDTLIACARNLVEDVRQVTSLIQGNSTLLFKTQKTVIDKSNKPPIAPKPNIKPKPGGKVQERPLPPTPASMLKSQISAVDDGNEYDYVNLETKEAIEKENEAIKAALPKDMSQNFDELVKQSETPVAKHNDSAENGESITCLDEKDTQLLFFYGTHIEMHITHLSTAIDAFLLTIKNNQPPKIFVGHSKFIVIAAHKLVYIGDTVHRNLSSSILKNRVIQNSDSLCNSLKSVVGSTKKAASEFPSVVAVQEMVDSVVDLSLMANNLKLSIVPHT